jgi:hypothetical protein
VEPATWNSFIGTNIALKLEMMSHKSCSAFIMLAVIALLASSCSGPFETGVLAALPVDGEPAPSDWLKAVPLDLEVWMGNIHIRPEIVALDSETSHRSTAQCHHGPSGSDPVPVRLQALYSPSRIFILAQWEDSTMDEDLGTWEWREEGWASHPDADDGIAFLWGPEGGEVFRCQNKCHMIDVDVYDGGTQMQMRMVHTGEGILDLWRWRAGVTGPYDAADDMVIDGTGKRGDEDQVLPVRKGSEHETGPETLPEGMAARTSMPYYLSERPRGNEADVQAQAGWHNGRWKVLFSRALETDDTTDRSFVPGDSIPFSLGVFDNTWTEHHVVNAGLTLWLVERHDAGKRPGRDPYEPLDF